MHVFMSKSQVRITTAAADFFLFYLPGVAMPNPIAPMFRQDGEGMSVSLTTDDGPDIFVVRETIGRNAKHSDIYEACDRLIRTLIHTYHNVKLHNLRGSR